MFETRLFIYESRRTVSMLGLQQPRTITIWRYLYLYRRDTRAIVEAALSELDNDQDSRRWSRSISGVGQDVQVINIQHGP